MPNISCCCPKRLACTSKINRWHMHHRQNSLIHSNRLVEVKQQRRNWKHTSAFWLKRAYMWHVKLDGDGQCDCCSQAYLSQDYKGLSASESFRQSELSTKAKMHEWGEDTVSRGGGSQTWEQNGRQGRRENAGCEGHIRTVCTGRRRKKTQQKTHICSGITIWI